MGNFHWTLPFTMDSSSPLLFGVTQWTPTRGFTTHFQHRNYKMYHRKAMDERDENERDVLLAKFADDIWRVEGSGTCTHRMRCILNKELFDRLWPDHMNYVDNSWKLIDGEHFLSICSLLADYRASRSSWYEQQLSPGSSFIGGGGAGGYASHPWLVSGSSWVRCSSPCILGGEQLTFTTL